MNAHKLDAGSIQRVRLWFEVIHEETDTIGTMPICLAASSQTQIGSSPFSNFRQRRSQSIMGTKQLKLDETVFGSPFFIHTRNRARCSPSLSQEIGLRICWHSLWLCEHCLLDSPTRIGLRKAGRATRAWSERFSQKVAQTKRSVVRVSALTPG